MARPRKSRTICTLPRIKAFGPISPEYDVEGGSTADDSKGRSENGCGNKNIMMGLDEYEAIRLIDLLGCTQEECAQQMGVARTTVQIVYESARRKLAAALVEGNTLSIRGGDYTLCAHAEDCCKKNCERRKDCRRMCGEVAQLCGKKSAGCAMRQSTEKDI